MNDKVTALLDTYRNKGIEFTVEDVEYFETLWNRLTKEFALLEDSALRSVESNLKHRKGIASSLPNVPDGASDLPITPIEKIGAFAKMEPAAVRVNVVKLFTPNHSRIVQAGIIGDQTGTCKFTTWENSANPAPFVEGKCYEIQWANVDFYNERVQLIITQAEVKPWNEDIPVKRTDRDTLKGFITKVLSAGFVNRCPVEKCRKPLTLCSGGYFCTDHGFQIQSIPDLRARVILDGEIARIVYLNALVIDGLTGFSVSDAEEILRTQPVGGLFAVEKRLHDLIFGRALVVHSSPMKDQAFAQDAAFITSPEAA